MNIKTTITESEFRTLCQQYGSPDEVPLEQMPEKVAAVLSMADRFFDGPETIDAAVAELKRFGVLE